MHINARWFIVDRIGGCQHPRYHVADWPTELGHGNPNGWFLSAGQPARARM
jgi:hypothetical protein